MIRLPCAALRFITATNTYTADSSDGSEDFVDASEGQRPSTRTGRPGPSGGSGGDQSPIPVTRVERVDDEPAYGEVPGTTAYKLRTADAVPDEIEVVPEGTRSRSASRVSAGDRPSTPGGTQIPKIIAEKIDPDVPGYGDVPGTAAYEMRRADATPDEIVKSPASDAAPANVLKGMYVMPPYSCSMQVGGVHVLTEGTDRVDDDDEQDIDRDSIDLDGNDDPGGGRNHDYDENEDGIDDVDDDDGGFGDDFDDFAEGEEADADDDDFGDFDDGFQQAQPPSQPPPSSQPNIVSTHYNYTTTLQNRTDIATSRMTIEMIVLTELSTKKITDRLHFQPAFCSYLCYAASAIIISKRPLDP